MLRLSGGSLLLINLVIYCKLSIICKQAALPVLFVLIMEGLRIKRETCFLQVIPAGFGRVPREWGQESHSPRVTVD